MARTTEFDAADYLDSPELIAAYLTEALESDDSDFLYRAINDIARAKGLTNAVGENGLGPGSVYKGFRPDFDKVRKIIESFGLELVVKPRGNEKV